MNSKVCRHLMRCGFVVGVTAAAVAGATVGSASSAVARRSTLTVVSCPTTFGTDEPAPRVPKKLRTDVRSSDAARLAFYSNGELTVLAPRGWACDGIVGADGSKVLDAYPRGHKPKPGGRVGESVSVTGDYTGHGPGAQVVCAYFPNSAAARLFSVGPPDCPPIPEGRITHQATKDVVSFEDAVGTVGEVIYPQVSPEPDAGVSVTYAECTLKAKRSSLCKPILADVLARRPPVVPPQNGG